LSDGLACEPCLGRLISRTNFFIFRSAFNHAHKDDDDEAKVNQQGLRKQVSLALDEMTKEEREPYAMQPDEGKRLHAEKYPDSIDTTGDASSKVDASATSSSTRQKASDDDDTCTTSSRPRRRAMVPSPSPVSRPGSNPSLTIPGTEVFDVAEYQWQQSPSSIRSLLDSPFDPSSPVPLPLLRRLVTIHSCFLRLTRVHFVASSSQKPSLPTVRGLFNSTSLFLCLQSVDRGNDRTLGRRFQRKALLVCSSRWAPGSSSRVRLQYCTSLTLLFLF
jgi:hypothetical protein